MCNLFLNSWSRERGNDLVKMSAIIKWTELEMEANVVVVVGGTTRQEGWFCMGGKNLDVLLSEVM